MRGWRSAIACSPTTLPRARTTSLPKSCFCHWRPSLYFSPLPSVPSSKASAPFAKAATEVWRSARPGIKASTCHAVRLLADKNRWLAEQRSAMAEDMEEAQGFGGREGGTPCIPW